MYGEEHQNFYKDWSDGMDAERIQEERKKAAGAGADCIAPENISALIDGEYRLTPAEEEHLKACAECADRLRTYRELTASVKKALNVPCPVALSERLVQGVNEKLNRSAQRELAGKQYFWSRISRVAAILILGGLIGYFLVKGDGPRYPKPGSGVSSEQAVSPQRFVPAELQPVQGIDIVHAMPVGVNPVPVTFTDHASVQSEQFARIEPTVRQIWMYDKKNTAPADVERTLRMLMEKLRIPAAAVKMNLSSGRSELNAEFHITSYQTVLLARALKDAGYSLVSSAQPQPEQTRFFGSGRERTTYTLSFLPKSAAEKK